MSAETKTDNRSPLAKSRDDFFASDQAKILLEPTILREWDMRQYLMNRLEAAYIEGYSAGYNRALLKASEAARSILLSNDRG